MTAIIGILGSVAITFIYCYFGTFATTMFEELNELTYKSKWYEYHIDFRKYVVIMILNGQKPVCFIGFDMYYLSLNTFGKVNDFML